MRAADLVEAQAKGRPMTTEEMQYSLVSLAKTLHLIDKVPADQLSLLASGQSVPLQQASSPLLQPAVPATAQAHISPEPSEIWRNPHYAIDDDTITCLVCGEKVERITRHHLTSHGMTVKEYREKFNYSPNILLRSRNGARAELISKGKMKEIAPEDAITDDYIMCMECGEKPTMLTKEHLLRRHGLTPEKYLERWGYPKDTKLVCKKPKTS